MFITSNFTSTTHPCNSIVSWVCAGELGRGLEDTGDTGDNGDMGDNWDCRTADEGKVGRAGNEGSLYGWFGSPRQSGRVDFPRRLCFGWDFVVATNASLVVPIVLIVPIVSIAPYPAHRPPTTNPAQLSILTHHSLRTLHSLTLLVFANVAADRIKQCRSFPIGNTHNIPHATGNSIVV